MNAIPDQDIRKLPVYVTSVSIHGIQRTNPDFIKKQLVSMTKSKSLSELLIRSNELKQLLIGLQIYKYVDFVIDSGKKTDRPDSCRVAIHLEEKKLQSLKAQWTVNTEGSMRLGGYYALNNIFRKGERLQIDANIGRDSTSFRSATFFKPLENNASVLFSFGGTDGSYDHWWSKFVRHESSIFTELHTRSKLGHHKLQWTNIWRELQASALDTPWLIRLNSGPSMKLSLRHQYEFDNRSDRIFPHDGILLRLTQELAFIKPGTQAGASPKQSESHSNEPDIDRSMQVRVESLCQLPKRLTTWLVGELTLSAGFVHSLTSHQVSIADRFFMGGPLDLRGFQFHALAPSEPLLVPKPVYGEASLETNRSCPVGASGSYLAGAHLYSHLPSWGAAKNSIASLFRLHAFAMTGSLLSDPVGSIKSVCTNGLFNRLPELLQIQPRYVLGAGIILRFANVARVEVNYCIPIGQQPGDVTQPGFQVGVGVTYM